MPPVTPTPWPHRCPRSCRARATLGLVSGDPRIPTLHAWLKNDDYDLNAVSVADRGASLIVLLTKRSIAADGAVKGTTVLAELDL